MSTALSNILTRYSERIPDQQIPRGKISAKASFVITMLTTFSLEGAVVTALVSVTAVCVESIVRPLFFLLSPGSQAARLLSIGLVNVGALVLTASLCLASLSLLGLIIKSVGMMVTNCSSPLINDATVILI